MCVLLHFLICTALRVHLIVVEALYKINYYYHFDVTKMSYVMEGTSRSSQFCIQVTEEIQD